MDQSFDVSSRLAAFFAEHGASIPLRFDEHKHELDVMYFEPNHETKAIEHKILKQVDLKKLQQHQLDTPRAPKLSVALFPLAKDRLQLCKDDFERLLHEFHLDDLRRLAHRSPMTFDIFPVTSNNKVVGVRYCLSVSNFIGLYVHYTDSGSAYGVLWSGGNTKSEHVSARLDVVKAALVEFEPLAHDPLYLLFIATACLITWTDCRIEQLRRVLLWVESHTGYQAWDDPGLMVNLTTVSIEPYFAEYCSKLAGVSTSLASYRRFAKLCLKMLKVIRDSSWTKDLTALSGDEPLLFQAEKELDELQTHIDTQLLYIDTLEQRAKNQTAAVQNLVNRHEIQLSLRLANSMKVLAIVTVVFLPATFVASLFSTTMFKWSMTDEDVVSSQFWIYWVVAIPLTAATVIIFAILNRRWKGSLRRKDEEAGFKPFTLWKEIVPLTT